MTPQKSKPNQNKNTKPKQKTQNQSKKASNNKKDKNKDNFVIWVEKEVTFSCSNNDMWN